MRRLSHTLLLVALAACAEPTAAPPSALEGRWEADALPLSPSGVLRRSLTFTRDGRFTNEAQSYGVYPGQPAGELSGYSRTIGTYRVDAERVAFAPQALVTWDRFYGADSRPTVQSPYPYGTVYDSARFTLAGRELTLRYLSYAADAPVPTTRHFRRAD